MDKDSLRISICSYEELYLVLTEQGLLPEPLLDSELAKLEDSGEIEGEIAHFPICYQYQLLWIRDDMVQEEKQYNLVRSNHNYWLVEQKLSGNRLLRYTPENFYQRLITMTEEEAII